MQTCTRHALATHLAHPHRATHCNTRHARPALTRNTHATHTRHGRDTASSAWRPARARGEGDARNSEPSASATNSQVRQDTTGHVLHQRPNARRSERDAADRRVDMTSRVDRRCEVHAHTSRPLGLWERGSSGTLDPTPMPRLRPSGSHAARGATLVRNELGAVRPDGHRGTALVGCKQLD